MSTIYSSNILHWPKHLRKKATKLFFAGKWHLGDTTSTPEHHGFEINKGGWDKGSPMGGYFSPWNNPKHQRTTKLQNLEAQRLKFLSEDFEPNENWWGSLIND